MQEILFRGKAKTDGRWVEGFYTKSPSGNTYIMETVCGAASPKRVDPKTVGQYIGLKDKNGKKIFEGDIVTLIGSKMQGLPAEILYRKGRFKIARRGYRPLELENWYDDDGGTHIEVIGNIHDNSELLKGGALE